MKKMLMFVLISMFIFTLNVQATLTSNNLELLDESPMLSKEYAIEKNRILYQENSYIETSIHYVDNEVVDIKDKMITESEYENSSSVLRSTCTVPGANDCWETASKKLQLLLGKSAHLFVLHIEYR